MITPDATAILAAFREILNEHTVRARVVALACLAMPDARTEDAWIDRAVSRIARNLVEDFPTEGIPDDDHEFDHAHNVADYLCDIGPEGNAGLLAWFASHPANHAIVDQAANDYGTWEMWADDMATPKARRAALNNPPDMLTLIGHGQLLALREIAQVVIHCARLRATECVALACYETTGAL